MAITLSALTVVVLGRSISVRCPYTGTLAGDEVATLEWKRSADVTWITGHALYHDTRANLGINQTNYTNPYANEFRGMVLGLTPSVSYDVRVSVTGTGVVGSPSTSSNNTTQAEAPVLPTNTILYVDASTGNDADSGLTAALAKLTINGAIAAASGATQIRVAPGTYTAAADPLVTIAANDIAIVGYGGGPILDGASLYSLFAITGNNFILQGLEIRRSKQWAVRVPSGGTDGWIDDCVFHDWNAMFDLQQLNAAVRVIAGGGVGLRISNCVFTRRIDLAGINDAQGNCVWIQAGASVMQSGYRFFNNTLTGGFDGFGGEPNFSANSVRGPYCNSEIYSNTIQTVADDCMELDGACMNVAVWGNTMKGIALVGISADSCAVGPLFIIRNIFDLLTNNNSQVGLGGAKAFKVGHDRAPTDGTYAGGRVYVYHNTVNIKDMVGAGSTPSCNIVDGLDAGWNNWTAYNNIFRNDGPTNKYAMEIGGSAHAPYGHVFDYNCWWLVKVSAGFHKWYGATATYNSWATWQGGGYDTNGKNVDPNLEWTDPSNHNYNLKSNSQLIGAGVEVVGVNDANVDDSTWRMNGAAPDMGAIESIGGTTVTVTVIPVTITASIPTPVSVGGGVKVVAPAAVIIGAVGTPVISAGEPQVIKEYWPKMRKQGVSHLLHAG